VAGPPDALTVEGTNLMLLATHSRRTRQPTTERNSVLGGTGLPVFLLQP